MNAKVIVLIFGAWLVYICTTSVNSHRNNSLTYYETEFYYHKNCSSYPCGYSCSWWILFGCYYTSTCYNCYSVRASRSVLRQKCEDRWTGPNCNIPYCSPSCTAGSTCTSENDARPTCKCLSGGQSKCKSEGCTSPSRSCYPGTCEANRRCICPPEFTGDNCETMLQTPQISSCQVKLFTGNPEVEVASANCAVEGHEAEITWVSKNTFSRIEPSYDTDYRYPYEPVLATETVHIKDAVFGVDFTKATVAMHRPTGPTITRDVEPHCRAERSKPEQHVDCTRRSISYTEFGQNSLPTNTTINITIRSRLGGYKTVKPDTKESISGLYASERRVAFKVDSMPPAHCRQTKSCYDPPISVKLDAVKKPVVEFAFTDWFDHESGIKSYKIEIYELFKSTSGRYPILLRAQESKDTFTIDGNVNRTQYTFPAPGVYSVELTVSDYANNTSRARKIMFYDDENHMEIKKEQLFVVEQASKESGYRWITDRLRSVNGVSRLSLSWKGRYSNSKHVQEGWLSRVPQWTSSKDIDDDLTDGRGGTRTIHQIDNANGTAFYKLAFKVDKQGGFDLSPKGFEESVNLAKKGDELPESTWMFLAYDVFSKDIFMPTLTGNDTVVIWMRAYDAVGYHVEDQILVRFDTSEPVLVRNFPAVLRPNSPDQYKSSIVIKATDMESGIAEVRYYIRDASLNVNITSGNVKVRKLKKSGATKRRRRSDVCNVNYDTDCYCINGGECFLKEIVVEIDHCDIDKHYADDKTMEFHYLVVNQAGKSVSPREPLSLNLTSGKPNCRPAEIFFSGQMLAIFIGSFLLGVFLLPLFAFLTLYGGSESCRTKVNQEFPWMENALPCMNGNGCECSNAMVLLVFCLVLGGIIFVPCVLIVSHCCPKRAKKSDGPKNADNSHYSDANSHPVPSHYQGHNPQRKNQNRVYQELFLDAEYKDLFGNDETRGQEMETHYEELPQFDARKEDIRVD